MFCASAVLGPLCDGLHSSADVLHYRRPDVLLHLNFGPVHWGLETCWWVPILFGAAGIVIGVGVPVLDELVGSWQEAGGTREGGKKLGGQEAAGERGWGTGGSGEEGAVGKVAGRRVTLA